MIFDLFSKRQRRGRGEVPDVYRYDIFPKPLRVQIIHIINDTFGVDYSGYGVTSKPAMKLFEHIRWVLCHEYGRFYLEQSSYDARTDVLEFLLTTTKVEEALDVVELTLSIIDDHIRDNSHYAQYTANRNISPEDASSLCNVRFREHGVGFHYSDGQIIRVDSEIVHAEAVKPTLAILRDKAFAGANEEFLKAHDHYRHGRHKECLVEALKAFESTLKVICNLRGWATNPNDTAAPLIKTCFENGLLPSYLEAQFGTIRSLLTSGIPTVRNKNAGHGQGVNSVEVPDFMARYGLNLTATSILFLVEAHKYQA